MGKIPKPEHQKSRGKCIFCKEWGVSKEHVFPDWLQQLLPKGPNDTHQHGTVIWALDTNGIPIRVPTIRRRQGQASSKKVRTVCENCNNGWLSALEERTKPLLRRMVCGKPHRLNDLDQRMLATWVAKTAMVAEGVQAGVTAIPQTNRDLLMSSLAPPVRMDRVDLGIPRNQMDHSHA